MKEQYQFTGCVYYTVLCFYRAASIKPLVSSPPPAVTSPTSSLPSEDSQLSYYPTSDEEVGFYTDEDDEDGETGFSDGSILNSDEDVTYESLVCTQCTVN